MIMGIVDVIIILFILLGGVLGFKAGAIKKLVSILGLIIVIVLAYKLKNNLSVFFYENLPFLSLWGVFKGIQVVNILFYEALAFLIISSVLMLIYNLILKISGLIEKILKATIILSIPSKIIGFVIGLIESYIWVYIFLFILTLPMINIRDIHESSLANKILEETPIISKYTNKTLSIYNDIYNIVEDRDDKTNKEINEEALEKMLKYDIITVKSVKKLISKKKIDVSNAFISKYKEEMI